MRKCMLWNTSTAKREISDIVGKSSHHRFRVFFRSREPLAVDLTFLRGGKDGNNNVTIEGR